MSRYELKYRGFRIRPFIRFAPIRIGTTKLYCAGPVAVFVSKSDE